MSVLAFLILAIQLASVVRHGSSSKFVEVSSIVTLLLVTLMLLINY